MTRSLQHPSESEKVLIEALKVIALASVKLDAEWLAKNYPDLAPGYSTTDHGDCAVHIARRVLEIWQGDAAYQIDSDAEIQDIPAGWFNPDCVCLETIGDNGICPVHGDIENKTVRPVDAWLADGRVS